jgi:hypothetical protein
MRSSARRLQFVGIYADDRPNEDTIIGFGIDNLFDQYDVR